MRRERTILCMKWGTLYSAEYVNVLFSACQAYMNGQFHFVCLTDDPSGLHPDIEHHPIPDIGLEYAHYYHGAWPKISVFNESLYGLKGRALFIDLDSVICGSLDEMFELEGDLVAIDSQPWGRKSGGPRTGTGVFAFDIGRVYWIADRFKQDKLAVIKKYQIEQDFVHHEFDNIQYWPTPWIRSYKYHLRRPPVVSWFLDPSPPPASAKILAFHGRPRPIELIRSDGNRRYRPVSWMQEYWHSNGGRLS